MKPTPEFQFRRAVSADVPGIARVLQREFAGFEAIDADPHQELLVACLDGRVTGVLHLRFAPGPGRYDGWRATIEAVKVESGPGAEKLGRALFRWAIQHADERGSRLAHQAAA
jgi:hypothetical protein